MLAGLLCLYHLKPEEGERLFQLAPFFVCQLALLSNYWSDLFECGSILLEDDMIYNLHLECNIRRIFGSSSKTSPRLNCKLSSNYFRLTGQQCGELSRKYILATMHRRVKYVTFFTFHNSNAINNFFNYFGVYLVISPIILLHLVILINLPLSLDKISSISISTAHAKFHFHRCDCNICRNLVDSYSDSVCMYISACFYCV